MFLSEGKAVGAGALQRGHVWVVSVGRKALMLQKSQLQGEPCEAGRAAAVLHLEVEPVFML